LAVFGGFWRFLAVFGGFWRFFRVFGGFWAVFGGFSGFLAVFPVLGIIWINLVRFWINLKIIKLK